MEPQITVVAWKRALDLVQSAVQRIELPVSLRLVEAVFEEAVRASKAVDESTDVFLTGATTGPSLSREVRKPVVFLRVRGFDLLEALLKVRTVSDEAGLIVPGEPIAVLREIDELLGVRLHQGSYRTDAEARQCFQRFAERGIRVVIGASYTCYLAEQLGMVPILLYSEATVLDALQQAVQIIASTREEKARSEQLKAILDFTDSAIVGVDADGRVNVFNPAAERLVGIGSSKALARPASIVIPSLQLHDTLRHPQPRLADVVHLDKTTVVANRVPIVLGDKVIGALATFQDVEAIRDAEQSIRRNLRAEGLAAKWTLGQIVGESRAIRQAIAEAYRFAETNATLLITGETGTGKELFAQGIHKASPRRNGPFVAVNCASLSDTLLESELFGYVEGAFTGARRGGKPGLFELADGGTIFLDEIGDIPLSTQIKLLRVLQEREVLRVGGNRLIPIDVRVIAATNRDLWQETVRGRFRHDLYYRITTLTLRLPRLRERREDLTTLALAFVERHNRSLSAALEAAAGRMNCILASYWWPGNVRELENTMESLAVLGRDSVSPITVLEAMVARAVAERGPAPAVAGQEASSTSPRHQERHQPLDVWRIRQALDEAGGNRQDAARRLGISRVTLWRHLRTASGSGRET